MRRRAQPAGVARLPGYRFVITARRLRVGRALASGTAFTALLWRLTARDRVTLDAWENVAAGLYRPAMLPVLAAGAAACRRWSMWRGPAARAAPSPATWSSSIAAAREWELPDAPISARCERWLPPRAKGNPSVFKGPSHKTRRIRMSDLIRHVIARGRVQGVGYRAFVADEAMNRGIAGWVRNRRDGTVEAVFSGPAGIVARHHRSLSRRDRGARRSHGIDVREATKQEIWRSAAAAKSFPCCRRSKFRSLRNTESSNRLASARRGPRHHKEHDLLLRHAADRGGVLAALSRSSIASRDRAARSRCAAASPAHARGRCSVPRRWCAIWWRPRDRHRRAAGRFRKEPILTAAGRGRFANPWHTNALARRIVHAVSRRA